MYSHSKADKLLKPPLTTTRLLDHLRERLRYMHYSLRTAQIYTYWVRFFIRWHGLRHPKEMGGIENLLARLLMAPGCAFRLEAKG